MVKTRLTAEEFFALPLERGELVDGEVREERPPKPEHGRIALRIGYHLMRWLEETGRGVAGWRGGSSSAGIPTGCEAPTSGSSPTKGSRR